MPKLVNVVCLTARPVRCRVVEILAERAGVSHLGGTAAVRADSKKAPFLSERRLRLEKSSCHLSCHRHVSPRGADWYRGWLHIQAVEVFDFDFSRKFWLGFQSRFRYTRKTSKNGAMRRVRFRTRKPRMPTSQKCCSRQ